MYLSIICPLFAIEVLSYWLGLLAKFDFSRKSQMLIIPLLVVYKNTQLLPDLLKATLETSSSDCFEFRSTRVNTLLLQPSSRFHKQTWDSSAEMKFSPSGDSEREWILCSYPVLNVWTSFYWIADSPGRVLGIERPFPFFSSLRAESILKLYFSFRDHSFTQREFAVSSFLPATLFTQSK